MIFFSTLLIGLASYRVWRFLAIDTIMLGLRGRLFFRGKREDGTYDAVKYPTLYYMWTCPWCLGTWITGVITLITTLTVDGGLPMPWLVFGGASAVTALLGSYDPDQSMNDEEP